MTITRTIGSGGDHADIDAWTAYVVANYVSGGNLTDHQEGRIVSSGLAISTQQDITGWAPGASNYTTTLTANTGASFGENANAQTNALLFATANGAYVDGGANDVGIVISVDKVTVSKLQIRAQSGTPSYGVSALNFSGISSATSVLVDECILDGYQAEGVVKPNSGPFKIRNSLVTQRRGASNSAIVGVTGTSITDADVTAHGCTFVGAGGGKGIAPGSYGTLATYVCAYINIPTEVGPRDADVSGSHNATTNASWTGGGANLTNSVFSLNTTNAFENSSTDFRAKSGGGLLDVGTTVTGMTRDIVGTSRPQNSTNDIGAWEKVVSSGSFVAMTGNIHGASNFAGRAGLIGGLAGTLAPRANINAALGQIASLGGTLTAQAIFGGTLTKIDLTANYVEVTGAIQARANITGSVGFIGGLAGGIAPQVQFAGRLGLVGGLSGAIAARSQFAGTLSLAGILPPVEMSGTIAARAIITGNLVSMHFGWQKRGTDSEGWTLRVEGGEAWTKRTSDSEGWTLN